MLALEAVKIKTLARRRLVPGTEADSRDANGHLVLAQAQRS